MLGWSSVYSEAVNISNFNFGFSTYKSDILVHLSQWQLWWWFWFTLVWALYFWIIVNVVRKRTLQFNPILNTSIRGRGKWGDFLVALIPLSWCGNILINSNFILRMIEWQNESSLFTLRVQGKQWYWVYKYDASAAQSILTAPKNIGHDRWFIRTPMESYCANNYYQALKLGAQLEFTQLYQKLLSDAQLNKNTLNINTLSMQPVKINSNHLIKQHIIFSETEKMLKLKNLVLKSLRVSRDALLTKHGQYRVIKSERGDWLADYYWVGTYEEFSRLYRDFNKNIWNKKYISYVFNERRKYSYVKLLTLNTKDLWYYMNNMPKKVIQPLTNFKGICDLNFNRVDKYSFMLGGKEIKRKNIMMTCAPWWPEINKILDKEFFLTCQGIQKAFNEIQAIRPKMLKPDIETKRRSGIKIIFESNDQEILFKYWKAIYSNAIKRATNKAYFDLKEKLQPMRTVGHHQYDSIEDTQNFAANVIEATNNNIISIERGVLNEHIKEILKNNIMLEKLLIFTLKFTDNSDNIIEKQKYEELLWGFKQKKYKRLQKYYFTSGAKYNPKTFEIVENNKDKQSPLILKSQLIGNFKDTVKTGYPKKLKYNADITENINYHKAIKYNRHRSELVPVTLARRLLRTKRTLVLPAHVNITVITNSYDVVHSWFIPGLGIKLDCVPGRSTHHTFYIDNIGFYYGQCAEICGRYHHHMPIRICALPFEHFLIWWQQKGLKRLHRVNTIKNNTNIESNNIKFRYNW